MLSIQSSKPNLVGWILIINLLLCLTFGCSIPPKEPQITLEEEFIELGFYGESKKYLKNGIITVYLTGTPYEIGFAHGKLCKNEIEELNARFFNLFDRFSKDPQNKWVELSRKLEKNIPKEYIDDIRGISDG